MRRTRGALRVFADGVPPVREVELSATEALIVQHLRGGYTQRGLALSTGRNESTVRVTVQKIRRKFGARSVPELIHGLDIGVYVVKRRAQIVRRRFDLASATLTLERRYRAEPSHLPMVTVRLHRAEIVAILEAAGVNAEELEQFEMRGECAPTPRSTNS
ncbi:MAG TPA: hypothetical protein VGD01_17660 [Candidatus Elarobacter sp.]|jgi:DNA-binding CsgD family transcriptional regulator